ncbi:TetR/AcrR family transcriptional regulator [Saccharopolyspora mangrovi]|uniref:TetR/AcrR family transcriptional regulator n=1 Tax=Saccharopolyspora mangrovi TaxID=3082379 RepID=A0ABU6AJH1_9PSEU|nr:TetR/AcrR family transcriptional regulator [Saccharopolyspora sp. S2-29]MEB3371724.1 TetR/AcrR family transcriptional regulator [Saccharopolyspora sp. S2-29]
MTSEQEATTGRGPYAQGVAAQQRILREAAELFGRHGFRGASLDEIAKRSGITKQGLLHHFPNKKSLLISVLKYRDEADLASWPGTPDSLVGSAVLDAWDRTVERNAEQAGLVRLSHVLCAESAGEDHPAREFFLDHFKLGYDSLVGAFEAGVEAGELRPDFDYGIIARQVIAMLEGLENQWLVDPANVDIVALFHAYTAQLRTIISA